MFAAIWALMQPYLLEIFKHQLDGGKHSQKWKRSTIGQFMALYDSLVDLEDASRNALEEFIDIGIHNGAIAKIVVTSRLEKIRTSSKNFVICARCINGILSIYNEELAITLSGTRESKRAAWYQLDAWLEAMPTNLDENRNSSAVIRFTKILPTQSYAESSGERLSYPSLPQAELEREAEAIKLRIIRKIKAEFGEIIDLHDKSSLRVQIDLLTKTVEEIAEARIKLAQFIKTAYPIERMMEDASASRP